MLTPTIVGAAVLIPGVFASGASSNAAISLARSQTIVLHGSGDQVRSVVIRRGVPVIVTGRHTGQSNFIVHMVGGGDTEFVFNEVGAFSGQALVEEPTVARYRVAIEADGDWTLRFTQPGAVTGRLLPATLTGHGSKVLFVRVARAMQPVVTANNRGQSNFIVHLVGFGRTAGTVEFVFNEIGSFHGQKLLDEALEPGGYLVAVQSDGTWTLRFTR